ncbi:MAG: orotidine-5'-phosphate decarboxylase [bacterium]
MLKPVIIALDTHTDTEAFHLVNELSAYVDIFKVGPGLFYRYGRSLIERIQKNKKKIFLDVKLFDIPNTVALAVEVINNLDIYSISVHLSGGEEMLGRVLALKSRPLIWGVSVLTSFSGQQLKNLGINDGVNKQVSRLVKIGLNKNIDGVVSSAHELPAIIKLKKQFTKGQPAKCIVPGIRLENTGNAKDKNDDQQRIMTPAGAFKLGADYIVIGRPVIKAPNPKEVLKNVIKGIDK